MAQHKNFALFHLRFLYTYPCNIIMFKGAGRLNFFLMTGLWFLDLMLEHMMPICCWKYFGAVTSSFATPEHFLSKSAKKGPFSISIFFSTFYFELMIFIPMIIYIKGYKKMIWLFGKKNFFSSYEFFSVFITFFIFFFPKYISQNFF